MYSKTTADGSLKFRTVLMIVVIIASAMAVLFVIHAEADSSSAEVIEEGSCGSNATYHLYADGTLEISGTGAMYDYSTAPAPWYDHCLDIKKIVISDDITSLGQMAFSDCQELKELTIPITLNSVVSDTYRVFSGCHHIEKVNFTPGKDGCGYDYVVNSGYDSWYLGTPWYMSKNCLKEITLADGISHIGADSFRELNITSLVIPDSVGSLGCHCFYNCSKLTDLTIPVSLNAFGDEDYPAFEGCMAVENVLITRGNGVPYDYEERGWEGTYTSDMAPWHLNSDIAKTIVISDDVSELGRLMFLYCNIKELTIPINVNCSYVFHQFDSLEKVTLTKGTGAGYDHADISDAYTPWRHAGNLKTIIVEEGVTYIGDYTFKDAKVETMILPNSLCSFGWGVFYGLVVKDLTLPISLDAAWSHNHASSYLVSGLEKITFTSGSGYGFDYDSDYGDDIWYKDTPWYQCSDTLKEIVFEDGIKTIGSNAFRELNITSLVIPDSVESLGAYAFYSCSKLTDLTVPITLDCNCPDAYPAFDQCNAVTMLRFTAGTDGIGVDYTDCAPFWCNPFHKPECIIIDSGISYIGDNTFAGYAFIGPDGEILEPECLIGYTFVKTDDGSYVIDDTIDDNEDVTATDELTKVELDAGSDIFEKRYGVLME